jgi:hypothetical protein
MPRQRGGFRRSGASRRTPALGQPDPPDLRSGPARVREMRRADEDRRLHHGPQSDSRDSGIDAQKCSAGIPARLAPPATSRSPGREFRRVEGGRASGRRRQGSSDVRRSCTRGDRAFPPRPCRSEISPDPRSWTPGQSMQNADQHDSEPCERRNAAWEAENDHAPQ